MFGNAQTDRHPPRKLGVPAGRTTIATVHNVVDINRRREKPVDRPRNSTGYSAHRTVLEVMLNEVLATELVGALRYRRYYFIPSHSVVNRIKPSFLRFAHVQQEQADRIAERLVQLGGAPQVDPSDLAARSRSRYATAADLQDMVREDLLFVRTAIENYDDMVRYFEAHDLTTAQILTSILAIHEEHAAELTALLIGLTPALRA
jgi:bacterioferritin